jgi:hypothetical protein
MEDRCPLCESIEVDIKFVKQYPYLHDIMPTCLASSVTEMV